MTKFLTAAAWSAMVLGGVAVADTPPAESAEVVAEEATAEVASEVKTIRYGDAAEAEVETEMESVGTVANVTIEGEVEAEEDGEELEMEAEEATAPEAE